MLEVNALLASLVVEALVVCLLVAVLLALILLKARNKDKKAIRAFLERIKPQLEARKTQLLDFYGSLMTLGESDTAARTKVHMDSETQLYQSFINCYLQRDSEGVADFGSVVQRALVAYHDLPDLLDSGGASESTQLIGESVNTGESGITVEELDPAPLADTAADSDRVLQLESENQRLQSVNQELQLEIDAMNNALTQMLDEYSRVLNDSAEKKEPEPIATADNTQPANETPVEADEDQPLDKEALAAEWEAAMSGS